MVVTSGGHHHRFNHQPLIINHHQPRPTINRWKPRQGGVTELAATEPAVPSVEIIDDGDPVAAAAPVPPGDTGELRMMDLSAGVNN